MQPHVNLGINFRKHFAFCYSKKKELNKIFAEEAKVNHLYKCYLITREDAMKKLVSLFLRLKELK